MSALEIRAHHHATRASVTVRCEHGLITVDDRDDDQQFDQGEAVAGHARRL